MPIKKKECGKGLYYYIRYSDNRLSCSLISKKKPVSHLDRKIGLVLRPKNIEAILSTSLGYTSEKSYYDFRNDSTPCTRIFNNLDEVNETCVDLSQCEVVGVIVLSDEKEVIEKAERIAESYNVEVINSNKKDLGKS